MLAYQLFGHVRVRVDVWLDPFADFSGAGYQIGQSLFGLGTGGVGGTGLGAGRPDLVPYAKSDFMLSSLGEELGPVRAGRDPRRLPGAHHARAAQRAGRARQLRQAAGHRPVVRDRAAGVRRRRRRRSCIPLTGLTTPFLSYGGSSLVANFALVALLLRVSNAARAPLPPPRARRTARGGGHRAGGAADVNTPVRRIAIAVMVMVLLLIVNLTYVQVVKAGDYRNDPRNQRVLLAEYSRQRGQIVAEGQVLASSTETNDRLSYLRTYPDGPEYAPVTGYYSVIYGSSGMERAANDVLNGSDDRLFGRRLSDLFTGRDPSGGNVVLTIDPAVQKVAYDQLTAQALHRRGGGAAARHRCHPRDGVHAVVRPGPAGQPRHRRAEEGVGRLHHGQAADAAQPGDPGHLPAGLDVQAGRRRPRRCRAASSPRTARSPPRRGSRCRARAPRWRTTTATRAAPAPRPPCATRCSAPATPRSPTSTRSWACRRSARSPTRSRSAWRTWRSRCRSPRRRSGRSRTSRRCSSRPSGSATSRSPRCRTP